MNLMIAAIAPDASGELSLIPFITTHWQFCLLHLLQFGIWGAWFVVLGNMLEARGFSRPVIGRIYATIPIGSMIAALVVGVLADKYFNVEWVIGVSHLIGAGLLFAMARTFSPWKFYGLALAYGIAFAPTLNLVNAVVFRHDADVFNNLADEGFPWIRVFGTIGWILAGLSHALILKKGQPINGNPLYLASALSVILGFYAFTLPATPPTEGAAELSVMETVESTLEGIVGMVSSNPVFFFVTFVAAMAMGLYFAFAALFLEKTGVPSRTVGPVMTIGQWIEIIFMFSLPVLLGTDNVNMNIILFVGITAWAVRFGFFAIGRPLGLVLFGIAIHGICFDFFFAAGMINANLIAPDELAATAQGVYGFLVYGLGMFVGSEASGWLNATLTRKASADEEQQPGDEVAAPTITNWRVFWAVPCVTVGIAAIMFGIAVFS
ncbi:MAG: MFS transporter [Planctomycetota bacterium]